MKIIPVVSGAIATLILSGAAQAQNRVVEPPPVFVSPDLAAPWVLQLRQAPAGVAPRASRGQAQAMPRHDRPVQRQQAAPGRHDLRRAQDQRHIRTVSTVPRAAAPSGHYSIDPKFLPQEVSYDGSHAPGTIVVDTNSRFLYLVMPGGKARRYGVGVGKEGFSWKGTQTISQKREWPDWRPPAEMIERERKKGRILPLHMKGGPANPLGARALYLGSTLYRIHGTNAPWTIGQAVSSGCIRMRNEDVIDLYERVPVGAKVVVI